MKEKINYKSIDYDPFGENEFLFAIPTTEPQQEIFASIIMDPVSSCAFNESISIHLKGNVQNFAMEQAFTSLVLRHDALRSTFSPDGLLFMVSANATCDYKLHDWSQYSSQEQKNKIDFLLDSEVNTEFDLINGPLLRARMIKLKPQQYLFVITGHHIVFDGWSASVFIDEIGQLYNAALNQKQAGLSPPDQFSQYAIDKNQHRNTPEYATSEQYWKDLFSDDEISGLDLPSDFLRPAHRSYDSKRVDYEIDQEKISQLTKLGVKHGCSLVNTMFASFNLFIYQLTGQQELVIGMPAAEQSILGKQYLIGHCVNMLPIKSNIQPEQPFIDFLKQVKRNMLDAYEHQIVTFGSLVKQLPIKRDPGRIPLIPITFNIDQKIESSELDWQDLEVSFETNPRSYENFELIINASMGDGKFVLEAQYNTNLFKQETIEYWLKQFESLLVAIGEQPEQSLAELSKQGQQQQSEIIEKINSTTINYADDKGVHELIHQQAKARPEKIAIEDESGQISYAELDKKSSQLAHFLLKQGQHDQLPIGLCLNRSISMVVALIAILKSGTSYVPLDPTYPKDRLKYMIDNSVMDFILSENDCIDNIPSCEATLINIDSEQENIAKMPETLPQLEQFSSSNCAYIIYTSGSTGNPKGVMISHKNAVNFLQSMAVRPGLTADDRLLAVTTISFDIAVLELYLPLIVGAQVILASRETAIDGEKLISDIESKQITCLQATPMTWRLMLANGWKGNKNLKMLCGGEAFPGDLAVSLHDKVESMWNMYGPTETTVWSSCHEIINPHEPLYIGQPIANTQIYILDDELNMLGPGKTGNLYIGGDGLAIGYLGAEELTRQKFIPHPFSDNPDDSIYDTGDLGRYHQNGLLECLGRNDSQVKLRGFRIELGEIQSLLVKHDAISQCVIRLVEVNHEQSIAAYVILHDGEQFSHSQMRQYARQKLPEYMIPSHLVVMDDFPKTLNGKIDAKALPLPNVSRLESNLDTSPLPATSKQNLSAAETVLIGVFKEVLGIDEVAVHDNFFELGGHSLLSLQVIQKLNKQCNNSITPRMMLTDTIEQLALCCEIEDRHSDHEQQHKQPQTSQSREIKQNRSQKFFFQPETPDQRLDKRLFGIYYPPNAKSVKTTGVILLYPSQQEYMRCHWGIKQMARMLTKQGFHVFKFDYFGSGDSSGESEQFSIAQCMDDIKLAELEFRKRSKVKEISIVGIRMGAILASMYARQSKLAQLVLWDPVVNGRHHLKELGRLHQQVLKRIKCNIGFLSDVKTGLSHSPSELLGYPLTDHLRQEILELDLLQNEFLPEQRTIMVVANENKENRKLKNYLMNQCKNFSYNNSNDKISWTDLHQYLNSIIPHNSIAQIISLLKGDDNG